MVVHRRASLVQQMGSKNSLGVSAKELQPPQKPAAASASGQVEASETDDSTVGSVASADAFDAGYNTLNALRYVALHSFRSSAKGLAQTSGARLKPILQHGTDRMLKPTLTNKGSQKKVVLTPQQQARRRRRRNNRSKIIRMLNRIDKDPLVASRVVLALAATCLFLRAGDLLLAATMSVLGILILKETMQLATTKALETWYFIGVLSLAVSTVSWLISSYVDFSGLEVPHSLVDRLGNNLWLLSRGVPRIWAIMVAGLLYRDISASRDGDDNAIDTIKVEVALLALKLSEPSSMKHTSMGNTSIVIQNGPVVVGSMNAKALLNQRFGPGSNHFETVTFSHFLESSTGASLSIYLMDGDTILGSTAVGVPGIHHMKISDWFSCEDVEMLIELYSRPLALQFLFRASTLIPMIACAALAVAFWK